MGGIVVDQECGRFVCDFVERLPTTDTGKSFVLHPWQRDAIMEFYSTLEPFDEVGHGAEALVRKYQYLYLEIPKKNGKSELAAALGLYHLFADGEMSAEVYVCAADKENAGIVFRSAVFMLETAPWRAKMVAAGDLKIIRSQKRIEFYQRQRADNGRMDRVMVGQLQVLSAEAYSKHGYKPSCVIFDELHSQPNRDLWDVMTFGAGSGRHQPVWIVLTTAGDDPDRMSIGWEVHEKAVAIRDARQLRTILAEGGDPRQVLTLRHTEAEDMEQAQAALLERDMPNWLPVLYGLTAMYGDDPDDLAKIDIWDEALWYQCNPSLGTHLSLRTLRLEAREAKKSEAGEKLFRWLRLNQWIAVKTVGWLPLTLYDKTQCGPSKKTEREAWVRSQLAGKTCYGGLDMSKTTDLTAFVLLFPPQAGLDAWVALFQAWRPKDTAQEAERRDHVPYESNEQNGIEYVNYTLLGYETQWSQEDSYKLLLPGERARGLRIKRELKVFLRGDTEAQSAYYTALRNVGALNPDEIRALEDMGGIPGGDSYYASWNYGPLDQWARLSVLRAMGKAGAVPPMEGGEEDG